MSLLKFEEIKKELFDITFCSNIQNYKAHKRCIEKDKNECIKNEYESLQKHSRLVFEYFLRLVKENNIEDYLNKLFCNSASLLDNVSKKNEFANFIRYLFAKAIYWHDIGKINPNFQIEKMDNESFSKISLSDGSNHSLLSAFLYINHSLDELYSKKWDEDEIEIIESVIYIFGYIITKHHGVIYNFNDLHFNDDLEQFLKYFCIQ